MQPTDKLPLRQTKSYKLPITPSAPQDTTMTPVKNGARNKLPTKPGKTSNVSLLQNIMI
jgi:hypothetical protein